MFHHQHHLNILLPDDSQCYQPTTTTGNDSSSHLLLQTRGVEHMHNALHYLGTSTPISQRDRLGLRGLIPAAYLPFETNVTRCLQQFQRQPDPLAKFLYLAHLQNVSERLYFALLIRHTDQVLPYVYTPTVGLACQRYSSEIYDGTLRGLYLSMAEDMGSIRSVLDHWPATQVTTVVVTDGERILGLGYLGVNGMAIPIGKLALYTAFGGINPAHVLPVHLDVGTNNPELMQDPYYLGLKQPHCTSVPDYDCFVAEFIEAVQDKYGPDVLIQFEDFGNRNAFRLLQQWKDRACTFNDDIQGTAAVTLAGLLVSEKLTHKRLSEHTILCFGAGEAGY